jgi:hypothetical protein
LFEDATPEREEELIEQAAQYIVRHDLEDFAQIALEGTAPFGDIVGELGFMMTYPLAVTFFNRTGSDFINMLGFNYKLNAEKILKRIEELKKVKELQEKHFKEQEKFRRKLKGEPEGWFARQLWRLGFKRKK